MEILAEALLQFALEVLARTIDSWFGFKFKLPSWYYYLGYILLASLLGIISIRVFPNHFLHSGSSRIINLLISPFIIGYLMKLLGDYLRKRDKKVTRLDTFTIGTLFAFFFAFMRFIYAK